MGCGNTDYKSNMVEVIENYWEHEWAGGSFRSSKISRYRSWFLLYLRHNITQRYLPNDRGWTPYLRARLLRVTRNGTDNSSRSRLLQTLGYQSYYYNQASNLLPSTVAHHNLLFTLLSGGEAFRVRNSSKSSFSHNIPPRSSFLFHSQSTPSSHNWGSLHPPSSTLYIHIPTSNYQIMPSPLLYRLAHLTRLSSSQAFTKC